jgi:hypothetical protein
MRVHVINGVSLEELTATSFTWREEGWEYRLATPENYRSS